MRSNDKWKNVREIAEIKLSGDELDYFMGQYAYVDGVSDKMKKYGTLDQAIAFEIMFESLGAADVCKDLWGRITIYADELYTNYKKEEALAQLARSSYESHNKQEIDALRDEIYIKARHNYTRMKTLSDMFKMKYDNLMATHYMCRSLVNRTFETGTGALSEPPDPVANL